MPNELPLLYPAKLLDERSPERHLYDAHTHRADTLIIAQVFPARQWGIYGFLIRTKIEQNPIFSKLVKLGD